MELAIALLVITLIAAAAAVGVFLAVRALSGRRLEASMRSFDDMAVLHWHRRPVSQPSTRAA